MKVKDAVGVNVHMGSSEYSDTAKVGAALDYAGISLVRDNSDAGQTKLPGRVILAAITSNSVPDGLLATRINNAIYNGVSFIHAPNEPDLRPGGNAWTNWVNSRTPLILKAVNGRVPVVAPPMSHGDSDSAVAGAKVVSDPGFDYGDVHLYVGGRTPEVFLKRQQLASRVPAAVALGKPWWVTETGFAQYPSNVVSTHVATSPADSAIRVAAVIGNWFAVGAERLFFYELLDEAHFQTQTPPSFEGWFGLFNSDFTPKPVADALHWFMLAFGDWDTSQLVSPDISVLQQQLIDTQTQLADSNSKLAKANTTLVNMSGQLTTLQVKVDNAKAALSG